MTTDTNTPTPLLRRTKIPKLSAQIKEALQIKAVFVLTYLALISQYV